MTIAETFAPDTFTLDTSDTALDVLADRAYMALGSCEGRLAKAIALVRSGAVTILGPHEALVQSQADPQVLYRVNGTCECKDVHRAPEGRCKHRLAAALAHRLVKPAVAVSTKVAPLPEAPASLNCFVTLAGRQAQITVRGHDASALVAELETLLQRLPVEHPAPGFTPDKGKTPAQGISSPDPLPAGWCTLHATQMKLNTKEGRTWYSHKTADGALCKGKCR